MTSGAAHALPSKCGHRTLNGWIGVRHGFDDLGLHRVIAQAVTDNLGSRAVMESVGMRFVRSWDEPDGEVEYALTRHAWFSRRLT